MGLIKSGILAFVLREQKFSSFVFSRWQAIAGITLIGILMGLDPRWTTPVPEAPGATILPLWGAILMGVVIMWVCFLIALGLCRWWLTRGRRWDGYGDLFNLLTAAWLVPDVLYTSLAIVGVSDLVLLLIWMYSIWVGANTIAGAIPKVSLGYATAGILISVVPMLLTAALLATGAFVLINMTAGGIPVTLTSVGVG